MRTLVLKRNNYTFAVFNRAISGRDKKRKLVKQNAQASFSNTVNPSFWSWRNFCEQTAAVHFDLKGKLFFRVKYSHGGECWVSKPRKLRHQDNCSLFFRLVSESLYIFGKVSIVSKYWGLGNGTFE